MALGGGRPLQPSQRQVKGKWPLGDEVGAAGLVLVDKLVSPFQFRSKHSFMYVVLC